jgi:hypothetical protein
MSGVSCALIAAVVPWVEVDLHLDLKVVIPLEIPTVLRLRLLNLGLRTRASEDRWLVAPGCDE